MVEGCEICGIVYNEFAKTCNKCKPTKYLSADQLQCLDECPEGSTKNNYIK